MGCNKSKSQNGGSEENIVGEQINPWEPGVEAHSLYGGNLEWNQNLISNIGFNSNNALSNQFSGGQFRENLEHQAVYGYSNMNVTTGSYGQTAPMYNPNNKFKSIEYIGKSKYNFNVYSGDNGSNSSINSLHDNFSQEQFQGPHIQRQCRNQPQYQNRFNPGQLVSRSLDHESFMGPPSRPVSRLARDTYSTPRQIRPLARRRSFNDGYSKPRHNNTVRHGSLENIQTSSRGRNSRNNFAGEWDNSGRRGQQKGVKRNSWDDDSTDNNGFNTSENNSFSEIEPHVKRRPSDTDDYHYAEVLSNDGEKVEKEETKSETQVMQKCVDELNLCDEMFDILDLLMFPEEWSSCAVDKTGFVDVSLSSPEGKSVQRYFGRSSQSKDFELCMTALARIENPFMHSYYLLKKLEIESRNEHVDELYLYHGTKKEHLSGILEDNLNWRLFSDKHRFGQGVSFSPFATYSSHYSDKTSEKVMLLFKVLASNSVSGTPDMKIPPTVDDIVYDTSIKDDTTVIVKYCDNEFYPLYKITYLRRTRN